MRELAQINGTLKEDDKGVDPSTWGNTAAKGAPNPIPIPNPNPNPNPYPNPNPNPNLNPNPNPNPNPDPNPSPEPEQVRTHPVDLDGASFRHFAAAREALKQQDLYCNPNPHPHPSP